MRKRVLRVVVLVLTISVSVTTGHREALRINPNDALAHSNLGFTFQRQDKLDDARVELREAIRIRAQPSPKKPAFDRLGICFGW